MVDVDEFCGRLLFDFELYFRERHLSKALTQSRSSCREIIHTCLDVDPDYIIELGTNYGLSTLSLAYAQTLLGKSSSTITTIDIKHDLWLTKTPGIQKGLILNARLKPGDIRTITSDFLDVIPGGVVRAGKVLVFYDIHDTVKDSYADRFLRDWVPLLVKGSVLVHDFYAPHIANWLNRDDPIYPVSTAQHYSGVSFEGYPECKKIVDWLNSNHRDMLVIPDTLLVKFDL